MSKENQRKWGNIALRDKANRILREIESFGNIAQLGQYLKLNSYKYYEFEPNEDNNSIKGAIDANQKKIWVNADLENSDKHFTLAHEIAHAELHSNKDEGQHIDYRKNNQKSDPIESEANVLAYELVMPLEKFATAYHKVDGNKGKLSEVFLVPVVQVKRRIEFLKQQIRAEIIEDFFN